MMKDFMTPPNHEKFLAKKLFNDNGKIQISLLWLKEKPRLLWVMKHVLLKKMNLAL